MSWSRGAEIAYPIIKAVKKNVKDESAREKIYVALINSFEEHDCDTMYENCGIDKVYDKFFEQEEE